MASEAILESGLRALKWNYIGAAIRAVSGFIFGVILARLLGPEPYGLVAAAWVVIGLGNLVADLGFGAALVQRKELSVRDIRYAFTLQVSTGVALTLIGMAGAPFFAQYFSKPQLVPVLHVLSWVFTFQALGQTATSLLKRDLKFGTLQAIQVCSQFVAYFVLGIPLALVGVGVWALVAAQLTQGLVQSVLAWAAVKHPVRPLWHHQGGSIQRYGLKVILTNVVNWLISNIDSAVVGRVFGTAWLGIYNRALYLTANPMSAFIPALQGVLLPASSRVQDRNATLRKAYLTAVASVALVVLPVFATEAAVAGTVIEGLFGKAWQQAIPLLPPLAMAVSAQSLMGLAGPILWGKGLVELELLAEAFVGSLTVMALTLAAKGTIVDVAWMVAALQVLRLVLMTIAVCRVLSLHAVDILRVLKGAVFAATWTAGCTWFADALLHATRWPSELRLAVDVGLAGFALLALVMAVPRVVVPKEVQELLNRVAGTHSGWLGAAVQRLSQSRG